MGIKTLFSSVMTNMLESKIYGTAFNVSTSTLGTGYTAFSTVKCLSKAALSPSITSKCLYSVSAGLNAVSFASSCVYLVRGQSVIGSYGSIYGICGWAAGAGARFFNCAGDAVDPTGSGKAAETVMDGCIDFALKGK